jgi:hypothetical protein
MFAVKENGNNCAMFVRPFVTNCLYTFVTHTIAFYYFVKVLCPLSFSTCK